MPLIEVLAESQSRVEYADASGEALREAADRLRRQGQLRHEHDRALALLDGVRNRGDVYLGLAAAGHALEQDTGAVLTADGLANALCGMSLLADQLERSPAHYVEIAQRVAAVELVRDLDDAGGL